MEVLIKIPPHCKYFCRSYLADRNVLIGATNRGIAEVTQKQYEIKRVIRGLENFQQYGPGDITLFELNDTVQYTPYIQPICFPEVDEKFTETSICYATGWGYTTPGGYFFILFLLLIVNENLNEIKFLFN